MIVYRDIISGDEMITDAFKLLPVMDKEGNKVSHFSLVAVAMPLVLFLQDF
jgi:hypothetical protein